MLATSQLHLQFAGTRWQLTNIYQTSNILWSFSTTRTEYYGPATVAVLHQERKIKKAGLNRHTFHVFPCGFMYFHHFFLVFAELKACEANRQWRFPEEPATSQAEWSTNKFRSRCSTLAPVQAANTAESVVEYAEARASGLQVQMSSEFIDNLDLPPCFLLVEGSLS